MGFIIGDLFFLSPSLAPSLPASRACKDREIVSRDLFLVKLEQKSPNRVGYPPWTKAAPLPPFQGCSFSRWDAKPRSSRRQSHKKVF